MLGATYFPYTLSKRLQVPKIVIFPKNWVKSQKFGQIPNFGTNLKGLVPYEDIEPSILLSIWEMDWLFFTKYYINCSI